MLFLYIFLTCYKSYENAQKDLKSLKMDADKWVKAGSARCSKNHPHCSERKAHYSGEPQDQMEIRAIQAYSLQRKRILAAAKLCGPDLLEHETLDIKGGVAAILGKEEERMAKDQF